MCRHSGLLVQHKHDDFVPVEESCPHEEQIRQIAFSEICSIRVTPLTLMSECQGAGLNPLKELSSWVDC
jgi:hypothetical protein